MYIYMHVYIYTIYIYIQEISFRTGFIPEKVQNMNTWAQIDCRTPWFNLELFSFRILCGVDGVNLGELFVDVCWCFFASDERQGQQPSTHNLFAGTVHFLGQLFYSRWISGLWVCSPNCKLNLTCLQGARRETQY